MPAWTCLLLYLWLGLWPTPSLDIKHLDAIDSRPRKLGTYARAHTPPLTRAPEVYIRTPLHPLRVPSASCCLQTREWQWGSFFFWRGDWSQDFMSGAGQLLLIIQHLGRTEQLAVRFPPSRTNGKDWHVTCRYYIPRGQQPPSGQQFHLLYKLKCTPFVSQWCLILSPSCGPWHLP